MTAPRRALIVIDVQEEYFSGNLPIAYPERLASLANIQRAMDAAARSNLPIVVVQQTAPATSPIFATGSPNWQLLSTVGTRPRTHFLEKKLPSAFAGTDLAEWVEREGIDTLSLAGYMIHNCVAATAMHAVHAGLTVEVLSDATGALPYTNSAGTATAEEIWRSFLVVFQTRFAAVLTTDAWISAIRDGKAAERGAILDSFQAALVAR